MIGDVSLGGVYVPWLLVLASASAVITALLSRLISLIGLGELVLYRPLNDAATFLLLLASMSWLARHWGLPG